MQNDYQSKIEELKSIVANMKRGVLFTGAGISVPSGIPDFRSENGLYETPYGDYSAEYMLSNTCFMREGEEFFNFYRNKMVYKSAEPNIAHEYFADLERQGKLYATVTQNIDGLHQAAGANRVYELHGSVYRNHCMVCGKFFDLDYVMEDEGVPLCDECGGRIHPDVVLYEEGLDEDVWNGAAYAISHADVMFVVGTSLVVHPAAALVDYFNGSRLILINKGETDVDYRADIAFHEDVTKVVHDLMK